MKSNSMQLLSALVVGLALGGVLGKSTSVLATTDEATNDASTSRVTRPAHRPASRDKPATNGPAFSSGILRQMWQMMDVSPANKALTPEDKKALEELAGTMDEDDIMRAIREIVDAYPHVGYQSIENAGPEYSKALTVTWILFERLAMIDTPSALEYSYQMKPKLQSELIHPTIKEWAEREPTSTYEWIQQNRARLFRLGGPQGARHESRAIIRMAEDNLPKTFTLLATMPENTQVRAVCSLAHQYAKDPVKRTALLSQVESLESTATQQAAISTIVRDWALEDPQAAASFVESRNPAQDLRTRAALAASWTQSDPEAALEWLVRNPAPGATGADNSMGYAFSAWSWSDPDAANSWLEGIEPATREAIEQFNTQP